MTRLAILKTSLSGWNTKQLHSSVRHEIHAEMTGVRKFTSVRRLGAKHGRVFHCVCQNRAEVLLIGRSKSAQVCGQAPHLSLRNGGVVVIDCMMHVTAGVGFWSWI